MQITSKLGIGSTENAGVTANKLVLGIGSTDNAVVTANPLVGIW